MAKSFSLLPWVLLIAVTLMVAFLMGGCSEAVIDKIGPEKIVGVISKPVLGYAKGDAETTIKWIDQMVADGKLSDEAAAEAKGCPMAVIDLMEKRNVLENPKKIEGRKGLIYLATVRKYGGTATANIREALLRMVTLCSALAGSDQDILKMIR